MARFLLSAAAALIVAWGGCAQDVGRTDRAWREYLYQTVRLGLPLLSSASTMSPYWPALDQYVDDARSLEPSADIDLLTAWVRLQEGFSEEALSLLKAKWPKPELSRWRPTAWGQALFAAWPSGSKYWSDAWLAWQDKAYCPPVLVRGLESLELTDGAAVTPLLQQAVSLYPTDRRFLPLIARHPQAVNDAKGLIARDLRASEPGVESRGWSSAALRILLNRSPGSRSLLNDAGYTADRLDTALRNDYGLWLGSGQDAPSGSWLWDADHDGISESRLTFEDGQLVSWTRVTPGSVWTLALKDGKPDILSENRQGASWTLRYETYPWALTLEYRWAGNAMVYRFPPLSQAVPLWPQERFNASVNRLPSVLADLWLPIHLQALAQASAVIEEWHGNLRASQLFLYRGEVWMQIEDENGDGVDDTWSYYRAGKLASVYRDPEGLGVATLREVYDKGLLTQVQSKGKGAKTEFVLFPQDGVQLWDPHGQGRPLDRLFVWQGSRLDAMVFSGQNLPWATMPVWEARP